MFRKAYNHTKTLRIIFSKLTVGVIFSSFVFVVGILLVLSLFFDPARLQNSKAISVQDGKALLRLNTFTFKNNSLYRYRSDVIVMNEEEDFESISVFSEESDETIVISATAHSDSEFKMECEGICKCYEEKLSMLEERRLANLIYSSRYASLVVISVIGLAAAKFVDRHIDHCFEKAKEVFSNDDESLLSCSMSDFGCEYKDLPKESEEKKIKVHRTYVCNGHCLNKRITPAQFQQKDAQEAMQSMDCENQYAGLRVLEITEEDNIFVEKKKLVKGFYYNEKYHDRALMKYRQMYLVPFCKNLETSYWYVQPSRNRRYRKRISPCSASHENHKDHTINNINCKVVK